MNASEKRARLRGFLNGPNCVFPASVADPISARIAEDIGFEIGMLAGSVASLSVVGGPDLILLTLSEFAEQARRICRATTIPICADADHGYGNALNVMRTVQELESAGMAGFTIEDTLLPRPFDDGKTKPTSIEEGVGKMKAAVAARTDSQLVLMARTGAIGMTGLEDTLNRIRAYQETGVDAIFLSGVKTRAEVEAIHATAKLPVVLGTMSAEIDDKAFLSAHGIYIALQGHAPSMAAMEATRATLQALRDGVKPKELTGLASEAFLKKVSRDDSYRDAIKQFMTR